MKKGNCAGLAMNPVFTPATSTPAALGNLTAPIPPANLDLVALLRDPAQVRQMLLGAGVEADILNKISDKGTHENGGADYDHQHFASGLGRAGD